MTRMQSNLPGPRQQYASSLPSPWSRQLARRLLEEAFPSLFSSGHIAYLNKYISFDTTFFRACFLVLP